MPWSIEPRFEIPVNAGVVSFIKARPTLSAHDEVAEVLTRSARGLRDVRSYCPNPAAYAYFVLHTADNRIFAIAFGQRSLGYRLASADRAAAIAAGGEPFSELGPDWVVFDPWKADRPLDASRWCKAAHDQVLLA